LKEKINSKENLIFILMRFGLEEHNKIKIKKNNKIKENGNERLYNFML
jgi:hypothetical protein